MSNRKEQRSDEEITANIRAFFHSHFPPEAYEGYNNHRAKDGKKSGSMIPPERVGGPPPWIVAYQKKIQEQGIKPPAQIPQPEARFALRNFLQGIPPKEQ